MTCIFIFHVGEAIVDIVDLSEFVAEQRQHRHAYDKPDCELVIPKEKVYHVTNEQTRKIVGTDVL